MQSASPKRRVERQRLQAIRPAGADNACWERRIVVEGVTEFHALPVAARKDSEADKSLQPLDIAGVAFFDAESDGPMPKFGTFFKALGLKTFSFYDHKNRKPEEKQKFTNSFDLDCEHQYSGFEAMIICGNALQ